MCGLNGGNSDLTCKRLNPIGSEVWKGSENEGNTVNAECEGPVMWGHCDPTRFPCLP